MQLWAFDEHRIGLKPIRRRVWVRRGSQPVAIVQHRYEWFYLNGFVQPQTGATCWWLLPSVRIDIFSQVLAAFAEEVGAGPDKIVLLVLDRAGWHGSRSGPGSRRDHSGLLAAVFARTATSRTVMASNQHSPDQSLVCFSRRSHHGASGALPRLTCPTGAYPSRYPLSLVAIDPVIYIISYHLQHSREMLMGCCEWVLHFREEEKGLTIACYSGDLLAPRVITTQGAHSVGQRVDSHCPRR